MYKEVLLQGICKVHMRHEDRVVVQAANLIRKSHGIRVTGGKAPAPLASFADLGGTYKCSKRLVAKLEELGWHEPTAIQRQAIPALLERQELFAVAPTGEAHLFATEVPAYGSTTKL